MGKLDGIDDKVGDKDGVDSGESDGQVPQVIAQNILASSFFLQIFLIRALFLLLKFSHLIFFPLPMFNIFPG